MIGERDGKIGSADYGTSVGVGQGTEKEAGVEECALRTPVGEAEAGLGR